MADYLSDAWFDDLNRALAAAAPATVPGDGAALALQQVVVETPQGEVAYWLRLDDATATAGRGRLADPDVTITENYDTAVAVIRGELSTEAAFLAGRVRVGGDLRALSIHQSRLQPWAAVVAAVRDRTTFG